MSSFSACVAVIDERLRQDKKFGVQDHLSVPNFVRGKPNVACAHSKVPVASYMREYNDTLVSFQRLTWGPILVEEVSEALEAAASESPAALRAELVQVAAVAVAWIDCLDRNGDVIGTGVFRRVRPPRSPK